MHRIPLEIFLFCSCFPFYPRVNPKQLHTSTFFFIPRWQRIRFVSSFFFFTVAFS